MSSFSRFSLTIARWLTNVYDTGNPAGNSTTTGDVTPRRRTILAVPEFEWAIDGLKVWVEQLRPRMKAVDTRALWLTERGSRVAYRHANQRFALIRDDLGLDKTLTLHSLRHSYVTHLIEFGYAERFVQEQVGHNASSTTAIYTSVSDDFKNRMLQEALSRVHGQKEESA